ncbi:MULTISPECIES: tRNA lysidine(34) synthetase TilS [unclassified Photobacterium]|uniref:tRNA lysidine(34) synthetase TilS n=1 Tax=unclassified Photobacterium TaxID=2628852 RepID=UPI001EDCE9E8|nr:MULTISPECIES: tRNA lysidine(34) synthetase TilS [unclassified Photobacterium]MCG3865581.1 tRNA lysidine(34) synthetase TilS [Photobacterium sp. Ph6]MCG3877082.1 tRNA lysidine(34) synthetase TilS [Photobacterium sp. Ph5]
MLYSTFCHQLLTHLPVSKRYVLAFSGGLDSRVLLDLMARFITQYPEYSCHAVYVHHGLSSNADIWADKCVVWAKSAGISCDVERVKVRTGSRISLEQAAREARYEILAQHVNKGDMLLTAQHSDDQIETFLLALKRGSGPAGLAAMPIILPFAKGMHLRPLLSVTRADIEQYGLAHQLSWVEDESNQDERYDRNFIRHQITPRLLARWPSIHKAIVRSSTLCGEQEALLAELLATQLTQAIQPDGSLLLVSDVTQRVGMALIRQWLKKQSVLMPSLAQLEQIWFNVVQAKEDANPKLCWANVEVRRYQKKLYLLQQWDDISQWKGNLKLDTPCLLPQDLGTLTLNPKSDEPLLRHAEPNEAITVRFHYQGDAIKPVGRCGSRKLKKLYQEYRVPSWLRSRTPLIFYGDKLAAVVGYFVIAEFAGNDIAINLNS